LSGGCNWERIERPVFSSFLTASRFRCCNWERIEREVLEDPLHGGREPGAATGKELKEVEKYLYAVRFHPESQLLQLGKN